jgi:hypothetical protein
VARPPALASACALLAFLPVAAAAQQARDAMYPVAPPGHAAEPARAPAPQLRELSGDKDFLRAAVGVFAANAAVYSYNRFVAKAFNIVDGDTIYWAETSWSDFVANLREGFEWDDNQFINNQFAHPYHGNLYYNAARSSGFNYWESAPFAIAGSLMWEYIGEVYRPALNDWINTSLGGIALGEMTYRASSLILDNGDHGTSRVLREAGALLVNPMRGINRLITGDAFRTGPNVPDRRPSTLGALFSAGYRRVGEAGSLGGDSATDHAFFELDIRYGEPFHRQATNPFDFFEVGLQINTGDKTSIGQARVKGLLASATLEEWDTGELMIGAVQHFDYLDNAAFELGGQSFGVALMYDRHLTDHWRVALALHTNAIVMGAVSSEYGFITERDYDYGPGLNGKFEAFLAHRGFPMVGLSAELHWIHTMNGLPTNTLARYYQAFAEYPVLGSLSLGAEGILFKRNTYLGTLAGTEFPDFSRSAPQLRIYGSWLLSAGEQ